MTEVNLRSYLLMWQFLRRSKIELPSTIECYTTGGSWERNTRGIRFRNNEKFDVTITTTWRVLKQGKLRLPIPLGSMKVTQLPWPTDLIAEEDSKEGRDWTYNILFGTILLNVAQQ